MAKLHLTVWCEASYQSEIEVPDGLSLEEAFEYAKEHLDEVPLGELEYLPYSDNLDDADLDFPKRVFLEEEEAPYKDDMQDRRGMAESRQKKRRKHK